MITLSQLLSHLRPLQRRVVLMIGRGIVKTVDDSKTVQTNQVELLADEVRENVQRWQQYGITSVPPVGSEALFLSVGGNRDHGAIVCVQDRDSRPTGLAAGEVALFDQAGLKVLLKANGDIEIGLTPTAYATRDDRLQTQLTALKTAINGAAVVAQDGGAAFKANLLAALASWPGSTASSKVKIT